MDTTIRNIDAAAYRALKAHAALTGRTLGDVLSEAIRAYLSTAQSLRKHGSLRDLVPETYPAGTERLSSEIDEIVYGVRSRKSSG
jgi:hypothetical protein